MGPKLRAAIWMALAIALGATPIFVLSFFPLKPLWLHVAVVVVLCIPGYFAIIAAAKNYPQQR
jgi:hypothetical protein